MCRFTLALALALVGCVPAAEEVECTDEARSSVSLTVVGPGGGPLAATVDAVDADDNPIDVECLDQAEPCAELVVGYEVAGEITISGRASDGCDYGNGSLVVDVPLTDDGCHVITQTAVLEINDWTDRGCE